MQQTDGQRHRNMAPQHGTVVMRASVNNGDVHGPAFLLAIEDTHA